MKFHSVYSNTLPGSSWTNTNTAGVNKRWLFSINGETPAFSGDRSQDRTSQFSSLCSGLCQLEHRTLHVCTLSCRVKGAVHWDPPWFYCTVSLRVHRAWCGFTSSARWEEDDPCYEINNMQWQHRGKQSSWRCSRDLWGAWGKQFEISLEEIFTGWFYWTRHISATMLVWSLLLHAAKGNWVKLFKAHGVLILL